MGISSISSKNKTLYLNYTYLHIGLYSCQKKMKSEVNRNDRLFSWVTLEPVEQIEMDDPSEKTIEEMDDVFDDIENRVTVLGNAIENRVNVLESPEKTIEVSNDRSQVINMNVINDHTNDKKT